MSADDAEARSSRPPRPRRPGRDRADRRSRTDGSPRSSSTSGAGATADGPYIAPGFVDVHVHGWGGHDAMGDRAALDGMARRLLRRGVTSFLPTAVTAPLDELAGFADRVRAWSPDAPADGAEPLGFNLEGPFLAAVAARRPRPGAPARPGRRPARRARAARRRAPADHGRARAARRHRAHRLAARPRRRRLGRPFGRDRRAGPGGLRGRRDVHDPPVQRDDRHRPSRARASPSPRCSRTPPTSSSSPTASTSTRPSGRSSPGSSRRTGCCWSATRSPSRGPAMAGAGSAASKCEVVDGRVTLVGTTTLAGSVDRARQRGPEPGGRRASRCRPPSRPPAATRSMLLGITDRGRLAVGQRADLVELDPALRVRRVMRDGTWFAADAD